MSTSRSHIRRLALRKCAEGLLSEHSFKAAQATEPDFAAIASRSALDGTAKRTKLYFDKDGITQLVDPDRGNRAEDAQIVGLRTLERAVKTDRDRSLVRREILRQLSLAGRQATKTAQQVGIRFGDKSTGPRRLDSFPQVRAAGGDVLAAIEAYRKNRPNPFVPKDQQAAELRARALNEQRPALPNLHAMKPDGVVQAAFSRRRVARPLLPGPAK